MSNRIQHVDGRVNLDEVIDTQADCATQNVSAGNTFALVEFCHRIVKKDGSTSGARACAASFRAARRVNH